MAFYKEGTPSKISDVTVTDAQFEKLRQKVAAENDLVRCKSCDHLLAKRSDGVLDIQHKRMSCLIENSENTRIQCPVCRGVTII